MKAAEIRAKGQGSRPSLWRAEDTVSYESSWSERFCARDWVQSRELKGEEIVSMEVREG